MARAARTITAASSRKAPPRKSRLIDYPRYGRRGLRRWLPSWKLITGLALLGAAVLVGLFVVGYRMTDVPAVNEARQTETTTVYFADGKTELGRFAIEDRQIVAADQIPEHVKQAVIAAEDRSFYDNRGISPSGIARAFWSNLRGNSTQGGSTITQQYVKNLYLAPDKTYQRKIQEAFIAIKIDQEQTKEEILTGYLNTIYFGRGAYGIQTAAQAYFGKNVQDLTVAEGAALAGIIPAPNAWDPATNPDKAQERFDYVLGGMVEMGHLDAAARAQLTFPATVEPRTSELYRGPNGYILADLRREVLTRTEFTEAQLDGGGLSIVTTIDPQAQQAAVAAMTDPDILAPEDRPATLQSALTAIDPATGGIKAMWGGPDYLKRQLNNATQEKAQGGSTFKPFTLVAALEEGISLRTEYDGRDSQDFPGFDDGVQNFGDRSYGEIDLWKATASSVNTVYVALNQEVGPENTQQVAIRAGLPEDTAGLEPNLANVLGSASPRPVDITHAFATFASYGVNRTPHLIASISQDGEEKYLPDTGGEQVFEEDVMRDTTAALVGVVERGSGQYAQRLDRPAAGKTGTSSENKSAWFVGYTPQLVASVALFNVDDKGTPLEMPEINGREMTGGSYPVEMWTAFMDAALEGQEVQEFKPAANIGKKPTRTRTAEPEPEVTRTAEPTRTRTPTPTPTETPTPTPTETATTEPEPAPEPEPEPEPPIVIPPLEPEPEPSDPTPTPTESVTNAGTGRGGGGGGGDGDG